jgi:hypothetical protein
MTRERYRGQIVVVRVYKVRHRLVWRGSIFIDRLVHGRWQEFLIRPGVEGHDFKNQESALAIALHCGRSYVDGICAARLTSIDQR